MPDNDLYVRLIDKTGSGARSAERNLKRVGGAAEGLGKMSQLATRGLTTLGAAMSIREVIRYADAWTGVTNRLKLVTTTTEQLAAAQADVFKTAQATRSSVDATANLYARLARSTESLHASQAQLVTVTRAVNEAFAVSGATAEEAQAAIIQLGQGLASGTLRGDELRSVLEQAPRLARAIAEGLDTDIGKIRQMGQAGELTAEAVFGAILKQSEKIHTEFQQTNATVSQGFTVLTNSAEKFVGSLNNSTGASNELYAAMHRLAGILDVLSDVVDKTTPQHAAPLFVGPRQQPTLAEHQASLLRAAGGIAAFPPEWLHGVPKEKLSGLIQAADVEGEAMREHAAALRDLTADMPKALSPDALWGMLSPATPMRSITRAWQGGISGPRRTVASPSADVTHFTMQELRTDLDDFNSKLSDLRYAFGGLSPELDKLISSATMGASALQDALSGNVFGAVVKGVGSIVHLFAGSSSSIDRAAEAMEKASKAIERLAKASEIAGNMGIPGFETAKQEVYAPIMALYQRYLEREQQRATTGGPGYHNIAGMSQGALSATEQVRAIQATLTALQSANRSASPRGPTQWLLQDVLTPQTGENAYDALIQWRALAQTLLGTTDATEIAQQAFADLATNMNSSADAANRVAQIQQSIRYDEMAMVLRQQAAGAFARAGTDVAAQHSAYAWMEQQLARAASTASLSLSGVQAKRLPYQPGSGATVHSPASSVATPTPGTPAASLSAESLIQLPTADDFSALYSRQGSGLLDAMWGAPGQQIPDYLAQFLHDVYAHRQTIPPGNLIRLPTADDFSRLYEAPRTGLLDAMWGREGQTPKNYIDQFLRDVYAHRQTIPPGNMVRLPTPDDFSRLYENAQNGLLKAMWGREGQTPKDYIAQFLHDVAAHRQTIPPGDMIRLPTADDFSRLYERPGTGVEDSMWGKGAAHTFDDYLKQFVHDVAKHRVTIPPGNMVKLPTAADFVRLYEQPITGVEDSMWGKGATHTFDDYLKQFVADVRKHRPTLKGDDMVKIEPVTLPANSLVSVSTADPIDIDFNWLYQQNALKIKPAQVRLADAIDWTDDGFTDALNTAIARATADRNTSATTYPAARA